MLQFYKKSLEQTGTVLRTLALRTLHVWEVYASHSAAKGTLFHIACHAIARWASIPKLDELIYMERVNNNAAHVTDAQF